MDISEIFKQLFTFKFILNLINNKEINKEHFSSEYLLTKEGMEIINKQYYHYIRKTKYHDKLKREISYTHFIKLECYKIIKHLFIREEYKPFLIEY